MFESEEECVEFDVADEEVFLVQFAAHVPFLPGDVERRELALLGTQRRRNVVTHQYDGHVRFLPL